MIDYSRFSHQYGVPLDLLRAIVLTESGGDRFAMRYEPRYRWLWDVKRNRPYSSKTPDLFPAPAGVSRETERNAQMTSWGLMQVMGAVARERGFGGRFLSELCSIEVGMRYGCQHLLAYRKRYGNWEAAAVSYNAGSPRRKEDGTWVNQVYIDKLRQHGWRG